MDGYADSTLLDEEITLASRFRLIRKLGYGSHSKVYLAKDVQTRRLVALKVLEPDDYFEPLYNQRFEREAIALARLNHSNLSTLFEFGFDENLHSYYMAIEYIDGQSLHAYLYAAERLEEGERFSLFQRVYHQICDGLAHAHCNGIIHRDIKPTNIMMSGDRVVLIDFGIATVEGVSRVTKTGTTPGTGLYMAPEQLGQGQASERSDVFSLALVFLELLVGRIVLRNEVGGIEKRALRQMKNSKLKRVIIKALQTDPDKRFASIQAFRNSIDEAMKVGPFLGLPNWLTNSTKTL